MLFHETLTTAL